MTVFRPGNKSCVSHTFDSIHGTQTLVRWTTAGYEPIGTMLWCQCGVPKAFFYIDPTQEDATDVPVSGLS